MSEMDDLARTVPEFISRRPQLTKRQIDTFAEWLAEDMPVHDAAAMALATGKGHQLLAILKRDLGRQAQ